MWSRTFTYNNSKTKRLQTWTGRQETAKEEHKGLDKQVKSSLGKIKTQKSNQDVLQLTVHGVVNLNTQLSTYVDDYSHYSKKTIFFVIPSHPILTFGILLLTNVTVKRRLQYILHHPIKRLYERYL